VGAAQDAEIADQALLLDRVALAVAAVVRRQITRRVVTAAPLWCSVPAAEEPTWKRLPENRIRPASQPIPILALRRIEPIALPSIETIGEPDMPWANNHPGGFDLKAREQTLKIDSIERNSWQQLLDYLLTLERPEGRGGLSYRPSTFWTDLQGQQAPFALQLSIIQSDNVGADLFEFATSETKQDSWREGTPTSVPPDSGTMAAGV